ncbi:MAG: N,N-dimethylformamidase [Proteobacteria bacterium]|nr:MAG: N,N-dimethylformamidase [Pseudomonadota bacterium]
MVDTQPTKTITGYCEPLSLRAGEVVRLMASSHSPGPARLDLVRIVCGDPTHAGPGFDEVEVATTLPRTVELAEQPLTPGSFGEVDLDGLTLNHSLELDIHVRATRPETAQTVLSLEGSDDVGVSLEVRRQRFCLAIGDGHLELSTRPIVATRWYRIRIDLDLRPGGRVKVDIAGLNTRSPGSDLAEAPPSQLATAMLALAPIGEMRRCLFAASAAGMRFDGRIARPRVCLDGVALRWDLAQDIRGRQLVDISGNERHGLLYQLPARGVTGPDWDGTHHAWTSYPEHYDAVHFHRDDLYDAGWNVSAELELPSDLPSAIYAFRLRSSAETDRIPFFVRPGAEASTADIALLMPSCTYMAYANHRMLIEGADFVAARSHLRPEHEYLRDHRDVGPSLYEKHSDGSGVMYSSRRRPVLQLRPGADGWNFTPDTDINAFLEHIALGHDIIADEDLHAEGIAALAPYRVIVTGTHPEYWSTKMLDALEQWLRGGGRLVYLGGNGFYWRVAFRDAWPGAIELRRAEDGVRNWQCEPGESYHSFNGEYGGLWRRLGRAPNALVGVGFCAQGFARAVGYRRSAASYDSRAAWIFELVSGADIGTSGLGGGAAGQEVDRYNTALGSPTHALVLASATEFGPDMTRTKEELEASIIVPSPDPVVRSDVVFFETPGGGAVFSVGSIAWFGALARDGYNNDIAWITANVLRRFLDPAAFDAELGRSD